MIDVVYVASVEIENLEPINIFLLTLKCDQNPTYASELHALSIGSLQRSHQSVSWKKSHLLIGLAICLTRLHRFTPQCEHRHDELGNHDASSGAHDLSSCIR